MFLKNGSHLLYRISLISILILTMSVLAACSNNENTSNDNSTPPTEDSIYAMISSTRPGSGYEVEYTLDEHGNITNYTYSKASPMGKVKRKTVQEFNDDGWVTATTMTQEGSSDKVSYTNELVKNDDGQVVKVNATSDFGTSETIYEYHPNGTIKTRTTTQAGGSMDFEEFDENGYRIAQKATGITGEEMEMKFDWSFDKDGNPTGWTSTGNVDGAAAFFGLPEKAEFSVDEFGNIIEMKDAENGNVYQRITWTRIDTPSEYAKLSNHMKR